MLKYGFETRWRGRAAAERALALDQDLDAIREHSRFKKIMAEAEAGASAGEAVKRQ